MKEEEKYAHATILGNWNMLKTLLVGQGFYVETDITTIPWRC